MIVTEPGLEPVPRPEESTLAMLESEELHWAVLVMSWVVPSDRRVVAVNCCTPPTPTAADEGETWMDDTVVEEDPLDVPGPPAPPQPVNRASSAKALIRSAVFMSILQRNICRRELVEECLDGIVRGSFREWCRCGTDDDYVSNRRAYFGGNNL